MAGSRRGSDRDDDLADPFTRLDEAMGVRDLVEGDSWMRIERVIGVGLHAGCLAQVKIVFGRQPR
jgi:hypothetical protein